MDGRHVRGGEDGGIGRRGADASRPGEAFEAGAIEVGDPPKPRQRPTGTSASNSISSASLASASVAGQLIRSVPSMVVIAAP
jgi:hypothetical protein